jgi:hypothetical protein
MALGYTTYKTPNPINLVTADLSDYEGHGVYLSDTGEVTLATAKTQIPYGVIVVGANSVDGTGTGPVAASALEIVDALGCVVQATAGTGGVVAGAFVSIGGASHFVAASTTAGDYNWGLALQSAAAGEQFLMRFQPFKVYSLT